MQLPDLVITDQYEGYYLDDLKKCLPADKFKQFSEWFNGQTGAIHEGKLVVYKWDFDQWLAGLPDLDGGHYG